MSLGRLEPQFGPFFSSLLTRGNLLNHPPSLKYCKKFRIRLVNENWSIGDLAIDSVPINFFFWSNILLTPLVKPKYINLTWVEFLT